MTIKPTHCAACGRPIVQPATGRTRRYCDNTCRMRHQRRRESDIAAIPPDRRAALLEVPTAAPAEEQLAATIEHEQVVILSMVSLSRELPPSLAWRAREFALEAADRLSRYFGVQTDAHT